MNEKLLERMQFLSDIKIDILTESKETKIRRKIFNFFQKNPYPNDKQVHEFAEEEGINEHELEGEIYACLSSFINEGKYMKEGKDKDFDPKQIKMGIKVEMEHVNCKLIAERIAKDHLVEIPDYYDRLKKMEEEASIKD